MSTRGHTHHHPESHAAAPSPARLSGISHPPPGRREREGEGGGREGEGGRRGGGKEEREGEREGEGGRRGGGKEEREGGGEGEGGGKEMKICISR